MTPQWLTSFTRAMAKQTQLSTSQSQHHSSALDGARRQHTNSSLGQTEKRKRGKEIGQWTRGKGGGVANRALGKQKVGNEAEAANVRLRLCKADGMEMRRAGGAFGCVPKRRLVP